MGHKKNKVVTKILLKHHLMKNSKNVAKIFISCFAKLRKSRLNFGFVFREISRISRKMSRNYDNENFRSHPSNFREVPKNLCLSF